MTWKVEADAANYFVNRQYEVELANGKVREALSRNQQQEQGNSVHITLHEPPSSSAGLQQCLRQMGILFLTLTLFILNSPAPVSFSCPPGDKQGALP